MSPEKQTSVSRWFGPQFQSLHPLLQELHLQGGQLEGEIDIELGHGLAGWIGRRLARKLGIPVDRPRRGFRVDIGHSAQGLEWNRRFEGGGEMRSLFVPVGQWPEGHWIETTGPTRLRLTVDVIEGAWHWRILGMRIAGFWLPPFLMPRSRAGKRIENGRYVFFVGFALPLLGNILSYSGALDARAIA